MHNEVSVKLEGKLPLFFVTGSRGSGKTYVITELRKVLPEFDIFDIDNLRECGITDQIQILNIWLRVARNIAESGRMTNSDLFVGRGFHSDNAPLVSGGYFCEGKNPYS